MGDDAEFQEFKSSTSCTFDDITGFIVGGNQSRFWLHRKHFLSSRKDSIEKLPFQNWECITLNFSHRDINLVIKDEKKFNLFLRYLIVELKTIDGERNSSEGILRELYK